MKILEMGKLNISNDGFLRLQLNDNGAALKIEFVERGEQPKDNENYLAVRVFGKATEVVSEQKNYVYTEIVKNSYGYEESCLHYCGKVTGITKPSSIIDPYFQDLQLGNIVHVHTDLFDFDIDGIEADYPSVGDCIKGTGCIMGILIKKPTDLKCDCSFDSCFPFGFTSSCTRIIEEVLKDEIFLQPEQFMSGVLQGKEEYISRVFNKAADIIGTKHYSKMDFESSIFLKPDNKTICSVIKLPEAENEFDYSAFAVEIQKDKENTVVYTLEKCDGNTYLLRVNKYNGEAFTTEIIKDIDETNHLNYIRSFLTK